MEILEKTKVETKKVHDLYFFLKEKELPFSNISQELVYFLGKVKSSQENTPERAYYQARVKMALACVQQKGKVEGFSTFPKQ